VFSLVGLISGPPEAINGAKTKINLRILQTNCSELEIAKKLCRGYVGAESEMRDLFIHRQHSKDARFIAPKKPQCPKRYRVRDNGRGIILQPHFSGPQEQRGSIQEHRLQLKFRPEIRTKRHSLDNPKYFLVEFTSGSAFEYPQNFNGFDTFINFH